MLFLKFMVFLLMREGCLCVGCSLLIFEFSSVSSGMLLNERKGTSEFIIAYCLFIRQGKVIF